MDPKRGSLEFLVEPHLAAGFDKLRLVNAFEEMGFAEARALDMTLDEVNLDGVRPCFMGWVYLPYLANFAVLGPWDLVYFASLAR